MRRRYDFTIGNTTKRKGHRADCAHMALAISVVAATEGSARRKLAAKLDGICWTLNGLDGVKFDLGALVDHDGICRAATLVTVAHVLTSGEAASKRAIDKLTDAAFGDKRAAAMLAAAADTYERETDPNAETLPPPAEVGS